MIRKTGLPTPSVRALAQRALLVLVAAAFPDSGALAQTPAGQPNQADQQPPQFRDTIEVVGVTPIHGLGIPRDKVPSNIRQPLPPTWRARPAFISGSR